MSVLMNGIKADPGGRGIEIDLKDFESLLSGKIAAGARISISLKPKDGKMDATELHVIACEFCNYLMGLMKKRGEM